MKIGLEKKYCILLNLKDIGQYFVGKRFKTPFKFSQFGFSENAPPQPKISLIMKYFDP